MSDFIIPKGRDFEFTVKVIEADSFLAQDLTNRLGTPTMKLFRKDAPNNTVISVDLVVPEDVTGSSTPEVPQLSIVTIDTQVSVDEVYRITINGVENSYTAVDGDTAATVTTALMAELGDTPMVTISAVPASTTSFYVEANTGVVEFEISSTSSNLWVDTDTVGVTKIIGESTQNAVNGMLAGSILADPVVGLGTSDLEYERGSKEDGYYLRPLYSATIEVKFSTDIPDIITTIENVYVTPTGV